MRLARLRHVVRVAATESAALIGLAAALCEQGRYEEAEAVLATAVLGRLLPHGEVISVNAPATG
ncbi:tetratricopeptide repeat protein [Streptomyces sp. NPDC046374]|uniref:tetratricopeptide repeat protein n=1 Tax=Streptomyces sp. NPDC046374 TaxID=3154917 RepID=UPI0033FCB5D4